MICKLDLSKGFYQVPMGPADSLKTTFVCPFGKFKFERMLCNALAVFQEVVEKSLGKCSEFARPYIDDNVFSSNWKEHLEHIGTVLAANLTANPSKCEWGDAISRPCCWWR